MIERFKDGVSSKKKAIPKLQHMLNVMQNSIILELTLAVKLLVYRVNYTSRATHLPLPTPIRYLTASLSGNE